MKKTYLTLNFKTRWELYVLKIKIGAPFDSRFMIAIKEIPNLLFRKKVGVLIG